MRRIYGVLLIFSCLGLRAQQQPAGTISDQDYYTRGMQHLDGTRSFDPGQAFALFSQSASQGNARAMNALGNLYASGKGVPADGGKALAWYQKAASSGQVSAFYNLGRLYQVGDLVPQDFVRAAGYYLQGASADDNSCKHWLAYCYFKGLGVQQSYQAAVALYSELAEKGDVNAWYFLGLCYRNGYGVTPDAALAKEWLGRAAARQDGQAIHEITAEPLPENAGIYSPGLQEQLKTLQDFREQFSTSGDNNISGTYKGYAVYYDFSHQYVHQIVPLSLQLQRHGSEYTGVWTEGDSLTALIKASFGNNEFQFDSSSAYVRHNYYSYGSPEPYRFNSAALSLKYFGDSVYLSGDVRFYSVLRKEPGQPMYIALTRVSAGSAVDSSLKNAVGVQLSLSPNPTPSTIRAAFTLGRPGVVQLLITGMDGRVLQRSNPENLPAGSYQYSFSMEGYAAGTYVLSVNTGGVPKSKTFVKL